MQQRSVSARPLAPPGLALALLLAAAGLVAACLPPPPAPAPPPAASPPLPPARPAAAPAPAPEIPQPPPVAAERGLVIHGGRILTLDPRRPVAGALAADGRGRIVAVAGSLAGLRVPLEQYRLLDLRGATAMPGFNDAHVHLSLGLTVGSAETVPELSRPELLRRLQRLCQARPRNSWIFVITRSVPAGFNARALDSLTRQKLVVITRTGAFLTRAALVDGDLGPQAPEGFVRGDLVAPALDRIVHHSMPRGALLAAARALLAEARRLGLTSLQLIDDLADIFEELRQQGELTARIRMTPLGVRLGHEPAPARPAPTSDLLRVDGIKYFHDDDGPLSPRMLRQVVQRTVTEDLPLEMHILGRHSLRRFLDAVELQTRHTPEKWRLFRVEHGDDVGPEEAKRLARLGIPVCANLTLHQEGKRAAAFPLRRLLDARVPLCLGSDWLGRVGHPRQLAPLVSMALATTHASIGEGQSITGLEALRAYTLGSAYAERMEREKGSLEPGKLADLVVLSGDPTTLRGDAIARLQVLHTVVGGKIVYSAPGATP